MLPSEASQLLRLVSAPMVLVRTSGDIVGVNSAFCKTVKRNRDHLIGRNLTELSTDPEEKILRLLRLFSGSGDWLVGGLSLQQENAPPLNLSCKGLTLQRSSEKELSLVAIELESNSRFSVLDCTIAELNESKKNLERTQKKLEDVLFAATEISIISTNKCGLISVFNRGAELMLGYTADEIVGKKSPVIFHDTNEIERRGQELSLEFNRPISSFNVFTEIANQVGVETREWTYIHKDKSRLTVSLTVTTIWDKNNEITGYLSINMQKLTPINIQ